MDINLAKISKTDEKSVLLNFEFFAKTWKFVHG